MLLSLLAFHTATVHAATVATFAATRLFATSIATVAATRGATVVTSLSASLLLVSCYT